jgi:hypothetical protein
LGISHLVKRYFKIELSQARKKRERSVDLENLTIFTCEQCVKIRQLFTAKKDDEAWKMIETILEEKSND